MTIPWTTSTKPLRDGFRIVKRIDVQLQDLLISQKKECLCGMVLIDPDEVLDALEQEYGNIIPECRDDIYQFLLDAIPKEDASIPDFDWPESCGNCANSFDASRRKD